MYVQTFLLLFMYVIYSAGVQSQPMERKLPTMYSDINDKLKITKDSVIHSIWKYDMLSACDKGRPSDDKLTDKNFLNFNFVEYLCLIIYDSTLHFMNITNNIQDESVIMHETAKQILKDTPAPGDFCQAMKNVALPIEIDKNEEWIIRFNYLMKNSSQCNRVCVSDFVNPLCAFILWIGNSSTFIEKQRSHVDLKEVWKSRSKIQNLQKNADHHLENESDRQSSMKPLSPLNTNFQGQINRSQMSVDGKSVANSQSSSLLKNTSPPGTQGSRLAEKTGQGNGLLKPLGDSSIRMDNVRATQKQMSTEAGSRTAVSGGTAQGTENTNLPISEIDHNDNTYAQIAASGVAGKDEGMANQAEEQRPGTEGSIEVGEDTEQRLETPLEGEMDEGDSIGQSVGETLQKDDQMEHLDDQQQTEQQQKQLETAAPQVVPPQKLQKVSPEPEQSGRGDAAGHSVSQGKEDPPRGDETVLEESVPNKLQNQADEARQSQKQNPDDTSPKESEYVEENEDVNPPFNTDSGMDGEENEDETMAVSKDMKVQQTDGESLYGHDRFVDAEDSHFFAYFMTMIILCIIGYLIFHNKQKILALALEGRSRRGTRRRPNTSNYRKLDSTLEEAVTSGCSSTSVTHVIY